MRTTAFTFWQPQIQKENSLPHNETDVHEQVTSLGPTIRIQGYLIAEEHVIIEGDFEGQIAIPKHGVALGRNATVSGELFAQSVTVLGRTKGTIIGTEKVEVRVGGSVDGRIVANTLVIEEGAHVQGSIDPTRMKAALAVWKHRLKQWAGVENDSTENLETQKGHSPRDAQAETNVTHPNDGPNHSQPQTPKTPKRSKRR
jgi:cytoskeletal protein CcmA (bactofilin family)